MIGSEGFDTIHSIDESPDGSIFVSRIILPMDYASVPDIHRRSTPS